LITIVVPNRADSSRATKNTTWDCPENLLNLRIRPKQKHCFEVMLKDYYRTCPNPFWWK
jgi:hypothetical protein